MQQYRLPDFSLVSLDSSDSQERGNESTKCYFFLEGRWKNAINYTNPLGSKGKLTGAFAKLLHEMWGGDLPYLTPIDFRV